MASSRKKKIGKALFVFKQKDDTMDASVMKIMDHMKTTLIRRGIEVITDEEDMKSNIAIMFVTKAFLDNRYKDIREIRNRFETEHCSMIICDDKDGKFVDFVKYCVESLDYDDDEDLARENNGYELTVTDVDRRIGTLVMYSKLKHLVIIPEFSPASEEEIHKFAVDFTEEAGQVFILARLDYDTIEHALELNLKFIYAQLLFDSNRIFQDSSSSDDLLFVVFVGCQCRCFDMTIISKLIQNLNFFTHFKFNDDWAIIKKESDNTSNGPFTLSSAFIRAIYGHRNDDLPYILNIIRNMPVSADI